MPWLFWLSGLSAGPWTKGPPVWFPVRAHAWVVGFLSPLQGIDLELPEVLTSYKINPSQIKNTTFAPQDKN